ncbi:helix-turn-helix transcriptional regulator [Sinorhizobium psoraleae]|uniref:HTH luxR-type domain-containing protein n=1 Tax=Sinorhizobium psoraleae TaxID=520838 RepID=A0ABT4KBL9_9HYPH|nr:hypothetical protein [Sinorhizobium psoraleae]MCZ4089348.1 hypothetical protein [Sinorhizobium psoraleae]
MQHETQTMNTRQIEIIRLLSIGKQREDIAALIGVNRVTVGRYITKAKNSVGCETDGGLVGHAFREGLIQ